jgi:hypothetical protein
LLLLEGNTGRQWCQVPVPVPVPLLATRAQDVEPLGRHDRANSLTRSVDDLLQAQVLLEREVASDVLAVLARTAAKSTVRVFTSARL